MGDRQLARVRHRTVALCGLIFLAGFLHQAVMSSVWHPMVMALATESPPAHAVSPPRARGGDVALASRSADGGSLPLPVARECPAGQMAPPHITAPPPPVSLAGVRPVAPPVAGVTRPPPAGPDCLSSRQRRALLQIFII